MKATLEHVDAEEVAPAVLVIRRSQWYCFVCFEFFY